MFTLAFSFAQNSGNLVPVRLSLRSTEERFFFLPLKVGVLFPKTYAISILYLNFCSSFPHVVPGVRTERLQSLVAMPVSAISPLRTCACLKGTNKHTITPLVLHSYQRVSYACCSTYTSRFQIYMYLRRYMTHVVMPLRKKNPPKETSSSSS